MEKFVKFAKSTGLVPLDGVIGERVLAMQYGHFKNRIPLLYLTVGFYFLMAIVFVMTQVEVRNIYDMIMSYMLPFIVIPLSVTRTIIWYRRRSDPFEVEKVARILISLTVVSGLICLICGVWAVMAWQTNTSDQRYFIPLIMAMGAFSVAYCLAIIPFSAAFNLLSALLPINILLLFSGDIFLIAVSVTVITAMLFLLSLLKQHFDHMVKMIELQAQMYDLANTDTLTGLLNRRALIEEYSVNILGDKNSINYYAETHDDIMNDQISNVTIAMLDLDGFKPVNDNYGHAAGDQLLRMISKRMKTHIGDYGITARFGGDEFAIMFVNKPPQFCQQMVDSLTYILSESYEINDDEIFVGVSYGLSHASDDIPSVEKLLSRADRELYKMKAHKKDTFNKDEPKQISLA